jgi:hypothetical protein
MDEQRALYESMCSARSICHEHLRLHVNKSERDRLFEKIAAEADADRNAANVGSSASFALGRNNH